MNVVRMQPSYEDAIAYFEAFRGNKETDFDKCCEYVARCTNETLAAVYTYSHSRLIGLNAEIDASSDDFDDYKIDVFITACTACESELVERAVRVKMVLA